jgi:hypothetical protein
MTRFLAAPIMRALTLAMTLLGAVATAGAQTNVYYAERGHWWVASTATSCRAGNRPAEDFNASPYNALEIVARRGSVIGVEVYFWPGLFTQGSDYKLMLWFDNAEPLSLPAKPSMGDFMLAAEPTVNGDLWKRLQTAKRLRVTVDVLPNELFFALDDSTWLLRALDQCTSLLPKS